MYGPEGLEALLSESDWVVLTLPMTAETEGMIGERELRLMKRSAHIINIARSGAVIRERPSSQAASGGAGSQGRPGCLRTGTASRGFTASGRWKTWSSHPINAGATPYALDRFIEIITENLRRYQAGEPLCNVVDKRLDIRAGAEGAMLVSYFVDLRIYFSKGNICLFTVISRDRKNPHTNSLKMLP